MPRAWRTLKNHPLDKVIGDINRKVSTRSSLRDTVGHMAFVSQIEPTTISEAIDDEHWTLAMQEELNQFKRNDVWELVPRPDDHTIIGGHQRKRSRTGKNVASSSAPPPPAHKYLDGSFLWFNDREEAARFSEKFEHREILPPQFSTGRFIHSSIPRQARVILQEGHFLDLLYITKNDYHPFLVRAFYSNLKKDEDGSLISNVNGVGIYLNEENIQILTGLHRDGQDLGLYVGEERARFNETALLEEVGIRNFVPTPQQRRPTIASMSPVYRFIFYVLTRILKPRKFNHTTLSQEDTKTIHAMIHNANINWCKFVMIHMFNATSDNRPLPYALLVMAILDEYHIKTDVWPKCKGTKHWVIDESSFHPGTDEATFPQPRPRRQPRATASTAAASTNPSLAEQMAALTTTLSRRHQHLQNGT
ncbi:unnamed protein product [Cuscuta campestris]|uniref:Reverse transcriptase Ty1/copia-type domain-containing protein n=1 Tax=Cuscuta campestris TaxID=132261 RepID=A0A484LWT6_9ASTE|nr:unnamed protein product [Cuscuta campestris]